MPRFRHRSTSCGSYQEHKNTCASNQSNATTDDLDIAKSMISSILALRDKHGKSFLHMPAYNLSLAYDLLKRAKSLDVTETETNNTSEFWQRQCLLQMEYESGYTPLHAAIMNGNLAAILLFLRHAMSSDTSGTIDSARLTQSPMAVLHSRNKSTKGGALIQKMVNATDKEGLSPLDLLGKVQQVELEQCRKRLLVTPKIIASSSNSRPRQSSFDDGQHSMHQEFDFLNHHMELLPQDYNDEHKDDCSYACEVVTFGRPNLCALGVVSSSSNITNTERNNNSTNASTLRPQRVQEFAEDSMGRGRSAVAVAAATHHTLVALKNGHLYACGLGKGGRLGIVNADDQVVQQCPLPRRVLGPLIRRKVVGVAAAENHSLCVTSDGTLFAWGSNRFGQLGSTEAKSTSPSNNNSKKGGRSSSNNSTCRNLPRRVEDLRNIPCIAVAVGEKHSVALSRRGEVYVWGDNTAGQLGVPRQSGIQKVQRVEALWNSTPLKTAIAISAAEQSTLVLTNPTPGLTHVNSIYSWGHGSHVPIRVHFENNARSQEESFLSSRTPQRVINPVAIACAKYHNAVITSNGHVYTWGLHAESLGRANNAGCTKQQRNSTSGRSTSSPQLVTGMLPQNGGGIAVALSASDQHTAVVTECGALYTWGATYGNNVLGHEGVRWQPSPKRVAGVHRAVNVAVAKEHTVLLIGSSFPQIPSSSGLCSLELLAAKQVAKHVDLFNVIPILIMAERTQSSFLIQYCSEFVRRNLDEVLNVGKKSVMNHYLNDMLADSLHRSGKQYRDDRYHPFISDVLTAGNDGKHSFDREWFSSKEEWLQGCKELSDSSIVQKILAAATVLDDQDLLSGRTWRSPSFGSYTAAQDRSLSCASNFHESQKKLNCPLPTSHEGNLDRCIRQTANMDLSTSDLARDRSAWLAKEIRGVRKKLNQIQKLEESSKKASTMVLSSEQQAKLERRPALEAELCVYETALKEVENRIKEFALEEKNEQKYKKMSTSRRQDRLEDAKDPKAPDQCSEIDEKLEKKVFPESKDPPVNEEQSGNSVTCDICGIKCPDETSFELHKNGRKHRNRVAQVAEEEKAKAAASIMERHQLEQIKASPHVRTPPVAEQKKNAWGVSSSVPKYTLPPPPHPAVPQVAHSTSNPWKSNVSKQQVPRSPLATSPPKFSPIMRDQNFSTNVSMQQVPRSPLATSPPKSSPIMRDQTFSTQKAGRSKLTTSKPINPSLGSPVWHSSPCAPLSVYSASDMTTPTAPLGEGQKNSFSLADFLAPKPTDVTTPTAPLGEGQKNSFSLADVLAPKPTVKSKSPKSWSSPQAKTVPNTKTLAEIQAEEEDFVARQDKSYEKGGGTWFLERRERADSLLEIQNSARKEQEEREFIEEQKRIEEQIQKELALQRKKHTKSIGKKSQGRKKNNKSVKTNTEKSNGKSPGGGGKKNTNEKPDNSTNRTKNKGDKGGRSGQPNDKKSHKRSAPAPPKK